MKKRFFPYLMMAASLMFGFTSCSSDSDGSSSGDFSDKYFSVENGRQQSGDMPESTSDLSIGEVTTNDRALSGGANFISISSDTEYDSFYLGVEGQGGYIEVPASSVSSRTRSVYYYIIPINYGTNLSGDFKIILKGRTRNGEITKAYIIVIKYERNNFEGDLAINLTFNKKKDLDLHVLTPSGNHIYYNERTWSVETSDGGSVTYGLDHDSNPACNIDGLNNENIIIPEEAIEAGEYQVWLDLYQNCDKSIGTELEWKLYVRYKNQLVKNTLTLPTAGENSMAYSDGATTVKGSGSYNNPVYGTYPHDAASGSGGVRKYVMKFTIRNSTRGAWEPVSKCVYTPTLIDIAKMKDAEEGIN